MAAIICFKQKKKGINRDVIEIREKERDTYNRDYDETYIHVHLSEQYKSGIRVYLFIYSRKACPAMR